MENDVPFGKCVALGIICITIVLLGCLAYNYAVECAYIKAGYTQVTLPGATGPHWVKP